MGAVHIGNEVHVQACAVVFQGFAYHKRAEVRAAYADVDHICYLAAG